MITPLNLPLDFSKGVAIVCNGEIEESQRERIACAKKVIGVDGGLNHLKRMGITPHYVVGDFDSVSETLIRDFGADTERLFRAKDVTDLEVAVEKARILSEYPMVVFAGLGNRLDHTLGNIFLLLRYPGKLFLESEEQLLFAASATSRLQIQGNDFKTFSLFPMLGKCKVVMDDEIIELDKKPVLKKMTAPLSIRIEEGEVVVALDKREVKFSSSRDFSLKRSMIEIFEEILQSEVRSKNETLYHVSKGEKRVFKCAKGQTVSLIPLFGAAKGIKTEGLKWELGKSTVDCLDKDFIGISNVCMKDTFSVEVGQGELLCIINHHLIDEEMVEVEL